jgi:hypothetical protein
LHLAQPPPRLAATAEHRRVVAAVEPVLEHEAEGRAVDADGAVGKVRLDTAEGGAGEEERPG